MPFLVCWLSFLPGDFSSARGRSESIAFNCFAGTGRILSLQTVCNDYLWIILIVFTKFGSPALISKSHISRSDHCNVAHLISLSDEKLETFTSDKVISFNDLVGITQVLMSRNNPVMDNFLEEVALCFCQILEARMAPMISLALQRRGLPLQGPICALPLWLQCAYVPGTSFSQCYEARSLKGRYAETSPIRH